MPPRRRRASAAMMGRIGIAGEFGVPPPVRGMIAMPGDVVPPAADCFDEVP